MSDRFLKKIITTTYNEFLNQDDFIILLNSNFNVKTLVVGAIETTTTEKEHYHCFIEFARQLRFSTFKNTFNNTHLEVIRGTPLECFNYVTKEGLHYSNITMEELKTQYQIKEEEKDICEAVIEDILDNGLTLYEILKKYPKFAFYNFKTIQEIKNISCSIDKPKQK